MLNIDIPTHSMNQNVYQEAKFSRPEEKITLKRSWLDIQTNKQLTDHDYRSCNDQKYLHLNTPQKSDQQ